METSRFSHSRIRVIPRVISSGRPPSASSATSALWPASRPVLSGRRTAGTMTPPPTGLQSGTYKSGLAPGNFSQTFSCLFEGLTFLGKTKAYYFCDPSRGSGKKHEPGGRAANILDQIVSEGNVTNNAFVE